MTQAQAVPTFYTDNQKRGRVGETIREYMGFFDESNGGGVEARKAHYATMINDYYDVVTDFYEHGWGQSFHFATRAKGESFHASLARAEYYLALSLGMRPGMKVLDVGCGWGSFLRFAAEQHGVSEAVGDLRAATRDCDEPGDCLGHACCFGRRGAPALRFGSPVYRRLDR